MTYYFRTVSMVSFSRVEHFNKTLMTILMCIGPGCFKRINTSQLNNSLLDTANKFIIIQPKCLLFQDKHNSDNLILDYFKSPHPRRRRVYPLRC